ncbi:TonB-linked outer membrane protein, SusC/RagA family [Lutibacter oricola]|uniref:TonB-linked outer membrane protein, SusC/RagA family n=1 Tax=Lutibacter oricola TaxID=762486 RepID=A0A1H2Z105_9FLAO|nr:TonB-dependent receptor [Lutibacter oricola]SDX11110.1 TonB-linked outer membrane protein, SusC/RagA family [Lutibacter oricola]
MKTKFNGILTLLFALLVQLTFAQEKTISGTVTDDSGPLPGVNVIIKGTSNGTQTDFDGKYSLKANAGDVFVFSYVGMETVEKTVGASNTINAILKGTNVLEEVVVVGYGTKAKRATTGSITTLKSEVIEESPAANFAESLQGKATGLQSVSASGQPGSNSAVRIRGTASINGLTEPLYIVDGIPITANANTDLGSGGLDSGNRDPLSNINPSDIESVTILKDASSTSIYGSRAANGVIMITTKRGKSGKAKFNFTSQVGISARSVDKLEMLNTQEFLELHREADINAGKEPALALLDWPDSDVDTDWSEYAYRDWQAVTKRHNLSVNGGSDNFNYFASVGHLAQEGIAVNSGIERLNATLNINATTSETTRVGMNFSYSRTDQATSLAESAYFASPVTATYLFRPTSYPYNEDGTPNQVNPVTGGTSFIQDLYYDDEGSITDRIIGGVNFAWDFYPDFTFQTKFGMDKSFFNYKSYGSSANSSNPSGGSATRVYQEAYNWTLTNTVRWNKDLNESHHLDLLLGQEINKEGEDGFWVDTEDFPNGILQNVGSAATVTGHSSNTEDSSIQSYFFNANYDYNKTYHLNGTFRRDASSRFGPDNKWGNFWSVGGNWVISNEEFMSSADWVDVLKLKSSYGVQGNLPSDRYAWQGVYLNDTYNEAPASYPSSTKQNLDLKWEEQHMFNVGLEFGLFNKLSGEITYFNRKTEDLIFFFDLEPSNGFTGFWSNNGDFKNSGFEIELSYNVLKNDNLNWNIGGNITFIENEVTRLVEGNQGPDSFYNREVGDDWNTFFLEEWAGVDVATGNAMWYDANGNITFDYNSAARQKVGKATPDFFGAVNTDLTYKNWFFNANVAFQSGNDIYNNTSRITNSDGAFSGFNQSREQLDRWQQPGDVSANPKRITGNPTSSNQRSTRWLEDGSYIRLKELKFGYNLPKSVLDNSFLTNGKVYVQGSNLLTFTDFNGDPEQALNGQHWFVYPNSKTLSLGLNLSF